MARLFAASSSQYLQAAGVPVSSVPVSLVCWGYPGNTTLAYLICFADTSVPDHTFRLGWNNSTLAAIAYCSGGSDGFALSSSGGSSGAWHHFAAVFAATNDRRAFFDGGNKGTNSSSVTPAGLDGCSIGRACDSTPGYYTTGRIAEAAAYSAALTDAEVAVLALGICPLLVRPASLAAYWPLVRNEDQDRVGDYNMTAYNSPTVEAHPPKIRYPIPKVYLYKGGAGPVVVVPAFAAATASAIDPTVILGSTVAAPGVASAVPSALDPAVVLGSLVIIPTEALAYGAAQDPSVIKGSISLTPAEASALSSALDPAIVLGSLSLTPEVAAALAQAIDPTVILGSIGITPAEALGYGVAVDPTVLEGAVVVTPAEALALASALDPDVILNSMVVVPALALATGSALDPSVFTGDVIITPAAAQALAAAIDPNVIISGGPTEEELQRILNLYWTFGVGGKR